MTQSAEPREHRTGGYTLILVAALLVAFAAISAVTLRDKANTQVSQQNSDTHAKLDVIRVALERYHTANGELPCPAPLNIAADVNDADYGSPADCSAAAPTGITEIISSDVWVGMVPFRVIGVSPDTVIDAAGNKIMYAIDTDLAGAPTNINMEDASGNAIGSYQYAIYSLGADGLGAWPATATSVLAICASSASELREENCDDDTLFVSTPILSGASIEASEYFDDSILYASHSGSGAVTCPTDTLSWGGGCEAEFTSIADGVTSPTTSNTVAGYSGDATAYCNAGAWDTPTGTCTVVPSMGCGASQCDSVDLGMSGCCYNTGYEVDTYGAGCRTYRCSSGTWVDVGAPALCPTHASACPIMP